jgi:hypothetical protein
VLIIYIYIYIYNSIQYDKCVKNWIMRIYYFKIFLKYLKCFVALKKKEAPIITYAS